MACRSVWRSARDLPDQFGGESAVHTGDADALAQLLTAAAAAPIDRSPSLEAHTKLHEARLAVLARSIHPRRGRGMARRCRPCDEQHAAGDTTIGRRSGNKLDVGSDERVRQPSTPIERHEYPVQCRGGDCDQPIVGLSAGDPELLEAPE